MSPAALLTLLKKRSHQLKELGEAHQHLMGVMQRLRANRRQLRVSVGELTKRSDEQRQIIRVSGNGSEYGQLSEVVRKLAESERQTEELRARLAAIVVSSSDAIIGRTPHGIITSWNKGAERIYGYSAEEAIGQTLPQLIPPEERRQRQEHFDKICRGERAAPYEATRVRKDGSRVHVSVAVSPIKDENGNVIGTSAIIRDIGERKQAEAMRAQLAAIVESSNDAIIGRTLDGIVTTWNSGAETLFGYSSEEMIGQGILVLAPPDQVETMMRDLETIKRGERVGPYETTRLKKDGKVIDVSVTVSPIIDANRNIVGAASIMRDISEKKRAEEQLRHLAFLLNLAPVLVRDMENRIIFWGRGAERLYGYTKDEALGRVSYDLLRTRFPADLSEIDEALHRTGEWDGELTHCKRDGSHVVSASQWVLHDGGKGRPGSILEVSTDITKRTRAETQVKALHQINLAITSTLDLPIILQLLLQKVDILWPYSAAHISLINTATGALELLACRNIGEEAASASQASLSASIIASKRPVAVSNMQTDERVTGDNLYRDLGLVSYLGLPLIFNDEVIGILSVFTETEHEFAGDEIDFMTALAEQASIAIRNSRFYEQSQKFAEDLLANQKQIRTLLARLTHARDEEAERIARDLHDESGQLLAAVFIALDDLAKRVPASKERVQMAKQLLEKIEERLRDVAHELHPTILKNLGFKAALQQLAAHLSGRAEMRITTDCTVNGSSLSPPHDLILYRVIQEALNNALRHSRASAVRIGVCEAGPLIQCSIEDDGIGFDPMALSCDEGTSGLGLAGIRERVELLNGTFEIVSAPGAGSKLFITFPQQKSNGASAAGGG